MGTRRKSRELALQMLFQSDLSGNDPDVVIVTFDDLQRSKAETREFAMKLYRGTLRYLEEIDQKIMEQAENWRMSRMAVVDRNIIRMAVYELFYEEETPKLVVIDEAIEIAKRFSTNKSAQFINGILDGILKRYNLAELSPRRG